MLSNNQVELSTNPSNFFQKVYSWSENIQALCFISLLNVMRLKVKDKINKVNSPH